MTKNYLPFDRGQYPVGVKSDLWTNTSVNRTLDVEIWYPAAAKYAGMDLNPATKDYFDSPFNPEEKASQDAVRDAEAENAKFPLVILAHGWAGDKRDSTFIGTHIASHGYVVVSCTHHVTNLNAVNAFFASQEPKGNPEDLREHIRAGGRERQEDLPFLVDKAFELLPCVDTESGVGITGVSYGGYSALMLPSIDKRVKVGVPMCPGMGTDAPYETNNHIPMIDYSKYDDDVKTLILVGAKDCILPLHVQMENISRMSNDYRMVVFLRADHNHFGGDSDDDMGQVWLKDFLDTLARLYPNTEMAWEVAAARCSKDEELIPMGPMKRVERGLAVAQIDSVLKNIDAATELVKGNLEKTILAEGVKVVTVK